MLLPFNIFFLQAKPSAAHGSASMTWIVIALLILLSLFILKLIISAFLKPGPMVNWHHHFDNFNYSSQEFYSAIEKSVLEKALPGISISRKKYSEGGALSANREYLYISRKRMVFVVCAAPFAKGFFVSWRQFEEPSAAQALLVLIPYFGPIWLENAQSKTFFQLDTQQMYKEEIHKSVLETTKNIIQTKGLRALSENEMNIFTSNKMYGTYAK
jgi:hypothetical protein